MVCKRYCDMSKCVSRGRFSRG